MLQTVLPKGPDAGRPPLDSTIDRTMTLDPAEFWPDPLDCPDWPQINAQSMQHQTIIRGRKPAEQRLEALGKQLNRDPGRLAAPTSQDRDRMFNDVFVRQTSSNSRWAAIGVEGIAPSSPTKEALATALVEACHLRGYLRKLDAQEAEKAKLEAIATETRHRRTVDGYKAALTNGKAEIAGLAEAVARHEQRLADEAAARRANEIKINLRHGHFEAARSANFLGEKAPDAPTFD